MRDDRGREVEEHVGLLPPKVQADADRRVAEAEDRAPFLRGLVVHFAKEIAVLAVGLAVAVGVLSVPWLRQRSGLVLLVAMTIVIPVHVMVHSMKRHPPLARRMALLNAGLCAACGYSIREIADEADGCRTCPECGAAWRVKS